MEERKHLERVFIYKMLLINFTALIINTTIFPLVIFCGHYDVINESEGITSLKNLIGLGKQVVSSQLNK